jgi:predicted transcriptional regulator
MSDMANMLSIRLPDALSRDLQRLCKRERRPASEIAREALRAYLAAGELRSLREKLRPHAEARGLLTDEDVFRAVS